MQLIIWVLSTAAMIIGAVFIASITRVGRLHLWVLVVAIVIQAETVLGGRILSEFDLLGWWVAWTYTDVVFLIGAWALWARVGAPPLLPSVDWRALSMGNTSRPLRWCVRVFALLTVAIYAVLLVAAIAIPQGMDDVLSAYLPRAGYWIQHGNFGSFPTSAYNSVQVSYPVAGQLPLVRSIVLSGGDRLVGIDQWFAALLGGVGIFGLGRALGARPTPAVICGLTWLMIPTVTSQAGLALTDLVSVHCVLASLLFGSRGWTENQRSLLALSAIAMGLALGTKQTVLFTAPGIAILLVAVLVARREESRRMLGWIASSIPVVFVIGGVDYVRNWLTFGHPLGEPDSFTLFAVEATTAARFSALFRNLARVGADMVAGNTPAQFADGVPGMTLLRGHDESIGTGYSVLVGLPWTGAAVSAVLVVCLPLVLVGSVRRNGRTVFVALIPAVSFACVLFWTRVNFSLAFSRYVLLPVALVLAAGAVGMSRMALKFKIRPIYVTILLIPLISAMMAETVYTTGRNGERPLVGARSAWTATQLDLIDRSYGFGDGRDQAAALREIDRCVGEGGRVAILLPGKFAQGALFGPSFKRRVVQLAAPFPDVIDEGFLNDVGADIALIDEQVFADGEFGSALNRRNYGRYALLLPRVIATSAACQLLPG